MCINCSPYITTREAIMNTVTITSKTDADGNMLAAVTYTETEILRFIEKAGQVDQLNFELRQVRQQVRDYFGELDYSNGETTIHRDSINELLVRIGSDKIRTKWTARVTIEATVSGYTAEDEDDATCCIQDDITIDIGSSADIEIDGIDVTDVEEEE